ncbi:sensor histidine kinase [Adonisia turfae]|uniref:CHASE2 domain-containing protein n=1 Tax=Adonisia turfae CCMR0081 TaxID=2292702 RepID=A0A6M0RLV4_9CYAN|nr:CHASE2 domain-containing protein [Adonisia turfae]NEZ56743.1 CHASE2 domain-containing protein [Adonisia turfae CCMR0081]
MAHNTNITLAWQHLPNSLKNWQLSILPGLTLTGLIIIVRLLGVFQAIEWRTLDLFLRLRSAETTDTRVLVVAIDETDIQNLGTYPLPGQTLATLLRQLDQYQPRAVGIDIFRDLPEKSGNQDFVEALADLPYVFGIEFLGQTGESIGPPPTLPYERVGFSDYPLDDDGAVRRSLLGRPKDSGVYQFSLAMRLTSEYLRHEGIPLENGLKNPDSMRFGAVEIEPFYPNTGGYVRADANAQQTLINFRSGPAPFRMVPLRDVLADNVSPSWIKDSVILIGIISPGHKDNVTSAALVGKNPGAVSGVEIHAHVVSQILSAVLDNRPLLRSLPDIGEYLWILWWGIAGIVLVGVVPTPSRHLILVLMTGVGLVFTSYVALSVGWWLPLEPPLIAFLLNGLVLPGILLYDQMLRSRIEAGQRVIRHTYNAVHNGPLQTLALILKDVDDPDKTIDRPQLSAKLDQLNQEIRAVYNTLEEELKPQNNQLHLQSQGPTLDLDMVLHELLYEVFEQTIQRDFPHFKSIKFNVVQFESMEDSRLGREEKRYLCRFLEEALCNVGRYAQGATKLTVNCLATENENLILVQDNGKTVLKDDSKYINRLEGGRGTWQAQQLAHHLKGQFKRFSVSPHGTCCELRWPISKPR